MIADIDSNNEDELISPPGSLSKDELRRLTKGDVDSELADMYQKVAECSSHGYLALKAERCGIFGRKSDNATRLASLQFCKSSPRLFQKRREHPSCGC
jgi:hypothetical protein